MNLLVTFAMMMSGSVSAQGPVMTLDQAIQTANQNAFAILLDQSNVEKQRQAVNAANGALYPSLKATGTYTRFNKGTSVAFGGGASVVVQPIDEKATALSLTWPIDISGNIHRQLAASKASLFAQKYTLEAAMSDTRQLVRTAYYDVLKAESQVRVAQEEVASNQLQLSNTQKQFNQGTVAKVDVLNAQTQLAQSESDLITAQNAVALAKQSLNNTLARPIDTPVEVVDVNQLPNPSISHIDTLVNEAQQKRPEALALEKTKQALALITRATEQGMDPSLSLSLTQAYNIQPQGFGAQKQSTTGVLQLSIPIFDGGVTRAQVKEARQNEVQADLQYKQLLLSISLQVRQATTNIINAKALFTTAESQVASAQEALRLAQLKYQQGEGIFLEVLTARSNLTLAENNEVTARYAYLQAVADLQHAVGVDDIPASNQAPLAAPLPGVMPSAAPTSDPNAKK